MLKKTVVLACVAVLATACAARAVTIETWAESSAGASDHYAYMALDFDGTGNNVKVFGYRWNDADTLTRPDDGSGAYDTYTLANGTEADAGYSEAMMITLMGLSGMTIGYHWHETMGMFIDSLNYNGDEIGSYADPGGDPYKFYTPGYFWDGNKAWSTAYNSGPAQPPNETWESTPLGISIRVLDDRYWDGWRQGWYSYNPVTYEFNEGYPLPAITPIPEPMTLSLLALGGSVLLRCRKARTA